MATAGELIVASLVAHGIDRLFCVPGESYLALLDALYGRPDIDTVVCRHEAGAGFMALADARLTGRPGVACVSRGRARATPRLRSTPLSRMRYP
jgi:acetolactate synthase I/II/III large subunit